MSNKDKAIDIVLSHNNLSGTVMLVELLLDGKSQKEISIDTGVSQAWISKVKTKYLKGEDL